jgi:hypothetical protein
MAPDCPEKLDWPFVWWVASYRHRRLPAVLAKLRDAQAQGKSVHVLRGQGGLARFLAALPSPPQAHGTASTPDMSRP